MIRPIQTLKSSLTSALLWQELRRLLRSQRSFWFLMFFLTALLIVVWQSWADFTRGWAPDGDHARGSRLLFYKLVQGHVLFLSIFTPFLMAPAIVSERESETLQLLISSPISVLHLILAKLLSPIVLVFFMIISGVPVLSLCFIGGGVSVEDVIWSYLIMGSATFMFGLLGLYCSTLRKRVYEVYLIAALTTLLFVLIIPFHGNVWHYINTADLIDMNQSNHYLQFLSPFFALREQLRPSADFQFLETTLPNPLASGPSLATVNGVTLIYLAFSTLMCLVLLMATIHRLRRIVYEVDTEIDLTGTIARFARKGMQIPLLWQSLYFSLTGLFAYRFYTQLDQGWSAIGNLLIILMIHFLFKGMEQLAHDQDNEPGEALPDSYDRDYELTFASEHASNPGLFLERRVQWFARSTVLLRLTYIALMLSILTLPLVSYDGAWLFLSLPFIVAAFFTLPLAATSVSVDHERGTLDLLRTTLLTSKQIIHAKYVTNLQYSFMIAIALFIPGLTILTIFGLFTDYNLDLVYQASDVITLLWYPVILFCALMFYNAIGVFCSAYFMKTNRALMISGIIILLCLFAPSPIPALNVANFQFSYGGAIGLSCFSPLGVIILIMPEGRVNFFQNTYGLFDDMQSLSYLFALFQCAISLILARVLYRKSMNALLK